MIATSASRVSCGLIVVVLAASPLLAAEAKTVNTHPDLAFISTAFENASPLWWEIDDAGAVQIHLVYDLERSSPNRANGHWHFQLQGRSGADLTLILQPFANVWNGRLASPHNGQPVTYVSSDGKTWKPVVGECLDGYRLRFQVHLEGDSLYVARLEPYTLADLEALKARIAGRKEVEIREIGHTVEGRPLEMIRIGSPDAPHHVLIRARAHPWESGGNWVVDGLITRLLQPDVEVWLRQYCLWVMPMANKDGVAHGGTRFNLMGKDLNRQWDRPPDPQIAPENCALESWFQEMIAAGRRPGLAIDLHNDQVGKLHVSRPEGDAAAYQARMRRLEEVLRRYTWFTEGTTGSGFHNPGSFGEGLLERYQIDACILELNAKWVAGLKDHPSSGHWRTFGAGLAEALFAYFQKDHP